MKSIFCGNQQKVIDYERGTMKIFCTLYNKDCPYNKVSKAQKKCMDANFIPEIPLNYNDEIQEDNQYGLV